MQNGLCNIGALNSLFGWGHLSSRFVILFRLRRVLSTYQKRSVHPLRALSFSISLKKLAHPLRHRFSILPATLTISKQATRLAGVAAGVVDPGPATRIGAYESRGEGRYGAIHGRLHYGLGGVSGYILQVCVLILLHRPCAPPDTR